jgi:hypothetical protein
MVGAKGQVSAVDDIDDEFDDDEFDDDDLGGYPAPAGLRERGTQLWQDLGGAIEPDAGNRLLIAEAARISDRLEQLDRILCGDTDLWLEVQLPRRAADDEVLVLRVDAAMMEARQQLGVLRQVLLQLARTRDADRAAGGRARTGSGAPTGGGVLDEIAAQRAARQAAAQIS